MKLTEFLYIPQSVKNLLIVSRIVSKVDAVVSTKEIITIKKNGVIMILYARKGENSSMVFDLKAK